MQALSNITPFLPQSQICHTFVQKLHIQRVKHVLLLKWQAREVWVFQSFCHSQEHLHMNVQQFGNIGRRITIDPLSRRVKLLLSGQECLSFRIRIIKVWLSEDQIEQFLALTQIDIGVCENLRKNEVQYLWQITYPYLLKEVDSHLVNFDN